MFLIVKRFNLFFRLSLANAVYENPSLPRRKILLSTGGQNYRPPLERSKSAPKLFSIEEDTIAEEIEQKRLIEELRTLRSVAQSWKNQEGWRLSRILDVLNKGSSDENVSVSSGCETLSTANSDKRTYSLEESHNLNDSETKNNRKVLLADNVLRINGVVRRRNSEGSPNFMTCSENSAFHRKSENREPFFSRSEGEESMEEDEDEDDEIDRQNSHVFEFEYINDIDEVVDYRPRGERSRTLKNIQKRQHITENSPESIYKELRGREDMFLILDALDEEVYSDESGYVEAPPKIE